MMYKYFILPVLIYLIVSIVLIWIPASEGYNTLLWKAFVGQVYALPILLLSSFISYVLYVRKKKEKR